MRYDLRTQKDGYSIIWKTHTGRVFFLHIEHFSGVAKGSVINSNNPPYSRRSDLQAFYWPVQTINDGQRGLLVAEGVLTY